MPVPLCRQVLRPPCPLGPQCLCGLLSWIHPWEVSQASNMLTPGQMDGQEGAVQQRVKACGAGQGVLEKQKWENHRSGGGCPLIPATQARVGLISGLALQWVLQAHPSSTLWPYVPD